MAFNPNSLSETTIKRFVDKLVQQNKKKETWPPKRAVVQEDVAVMLGYKNWHELSKSVSSTLPPTQNLDLAQIHFPPSSLSSEGVPFPKTCNFEDATGHFLIKGADKIRRKYFDDFLTFNPHIPFLFVQGENGLPFESSNDRPFFNYSHHSHEKDDNITPLHHSFLTPTLCKAIGNQVAYEVGQNQHFQAIQEYVAHILLHTNLGPKLDTRSLIYGSAIEEIAQALGVDPKTIPNATHTNEMNDFWSDPYLVATTGNILWSVLANVTTRVFLNALSSPTPSVGLRVYEDMERGGSLNRLIVFCNVWMRMKPGPKIIVIDGLRYNSTLYASLTTNLSAWGEANTVVFVGANSDADLPNDPKSFQRFVSRFSLVGGF